jgi:hypothetical protein
MDGKWYNIGGLKSATLWTYLFNNENLELEVEFLLPMVVYTKQ